MITIFHYVFAKSWQKHENHVESTALNWHLMGRSAYYSEHRSILKSLAYIQRICLPLSPLSPSNNVVLLQADSTAGRFWNIMVFISAMQECVLHTIQIVEWYINNEITVNILPLKIKGLSVKVRRFKMWFIGLCFQLCFVRFVWVRIMSSE